MVRRLNLVPSHALGLLVLTLPLLACPTSTPYAVQEEAGNRSSAADPDQPGQPPATDKPAAVQPKPNGVDASRLAKLTGTSAAKDDKSKRLREALTALDGGDVDAALKAFVPQIRWQVPGRRSEALVGHDPLRRALKLWTSPDLELSTRQVIRLSPRFFALQLAVYAVSKELRNDIVLLVRTTEDGMVQAVEQFGDPMGPVMSRPSDTRSTLALGAPGEFMLIAGPASIAHAATTKRLQEAISARQWDKLSQWVANDAVHHAITVRQTRRGPQGYEQAYTVATGTTGVMKATRHFSVGDYVLIQGTVSGRDDKPERTLGFVDVHKLEEGKVKTTWHYLNMRGRPLDEGNPTGGTKVIKPAAVKPPDEG